MPSRHLPTAVTGVAGAVVAACAALLGLFLLRPDAVERNTVGTPPRLLFDASGIEALSAADAAAPRVLAIAHNGGDSITAVRAAREHGATAIEIDVAMVGGRLRAAHDEPNPLGAVFTRAPSVGRVWSEAGDVDLVVLDLKSDSAPFARAVAGFLDAHDGPEVAVVATDARLLGMLHRMRPGTALHLSIGSSAVLQSVLAGLGTGDVPLAGVSVRHTLLDEASVAALHERGLQVAAWTVNDPVRVAELAGHGIDAVATDNLAVLGAGRATS